MGRAKRFKKKGRFIQLWWEIVDSEAWQYLRNASRVALIHIMRRVDNDNPGELFLTYQQMEKIMQRHTFRGAIRQLEEVGFIRKQTYGGLFRKRCAYLLIDEWKHFGQSSSALFAPSRYEKAHRGNNEKGQNRVLTV